MWKEIEHYHSKGSRKTNGPLKCNNWTYRRRSLLFGLFKTVDFDYTCVGCGTKHYHINPLMHFGNITFHDEPDKTYYAVVIMTCPTCRAENVFENGDGDYLHEQARYTQQKETKLNENNNSEDR